MLSIAVFSGCGEEELPPAPETATMTDIDGNVYQTVKVGNQWWMAENLKVTKYRNGDSIEFAQPAENWIDAVGGAYCIYGDNAPNNATTVGFLYNWQAVINTNKLAPEGWRIPTDEDWKELEMFLGMTQTDADKTGWRGTNQGEKLRIEGELGWIRYEDVWATNESGFTARAGGCRLFNGMWGSPGLFHTGYWWTASENADSTAWFRYLDYKNAEVFRYYASMKYGFSVRCVKD